MLTRNRGFTLVEIMISLSAMALVVAYSMGTFTVQNDTATVIDQLSEAQQNMLAAASLLERDARNAGYLMPTGGAACTSDQIVGPDTLFFADADAIRDIEDLPVADQGSRLGVPIATAPDLPNPLNLALGQSILDGEASYLSSGASLAPDSDFRENGGAIAIDLANPSRGVACGTVTDVSSGIVQITFTTTLTIALSAPDVRILPAHVYSIDSSGTPSVLRRDGIALANDVEDLQAAFFFDENDNGVVDIIDGKLEYKGDTVGNILNMQQVDGRDLREIRLNLVVATSGDDPRKSTNAGRAQVTENRHAASVSEASDGRHRRIYTSTIRLRNVSS
jgi:prepilin-type N-terminal cleavage/methylation domain-containing protein